MHNTHCKLYEYQQSEANTFPVFVSLLLVDPMHHWLLIFSFSLLCNSFSAIMLCSMYSNDIQELAHLPPSITFYLPPPNIKPAPSACFSAVHHQKFTIVFMSLNHSTDHILCFITLKTVIYYDTYKILRQVTLERICVRKCENSICIMNDMANIN